MDLRKLKKLIDLVEESGIAEIEVTEGEEKVRITRTIANNQPVYAAMHHALRRCLVTRHQLGRKTWHGHQLRTADYPR